MQTGRSRRAGAARPRDARLERVAYFRVVYFRVVYLRVAYFRILFFCVINSRVVDFSGLACRRNLGPRIDVFHLCCADIEAVMGQCFRWSSRRGFEVGLRSGGAVVRASSR